MICSMAICPGMPCAFPSRFISWNRRFEPQVKNASAFPPAFAVDPIDALRSTQPEFAFVWRRAEQVEELARFHRECLGRGIDDEMLVFGIDPVVRHDWAQRFLSWNVPLGRCGRRTGTHDG